MATASHDPDSSNNRSVETDAHEETNITAKNEEGRGNKSKQQSLLQFTTVHKNACSPSLMGQHSQSRKPANKKVRERHNHQLKTYQSKPTPGQCWQCIAKEFAMRSGKKPPKGGTTRAVQGRNQQGSVPLRSLQSSHLQQRKTKRLWLHCQRLHHHQEPWQKLRSATWLNFRIPSTNISVVNYFLRHSREWKRMWSRQQRLWLDYPSQFKTARRMFGSFVYIKTSSYCL